VLTIWVASRTSRMQMPVTLQSFVPVTTVSTRAALCSVARGDLVVPRTRRRLRNRAFCIAGPTAWNSLPSDIRTASSVTTFKNLLKTHLFIQSYYSYNFERPCAYAGVQSLSARRSELGRRFFRSVTVADSSQMMRFGNSFPASTTHCLSNTTN